VSAVLSVASVQRIAVREGVGMKEERGREGNLESVWLVGLCLPGGSTSRILQETGKTTTTDGLWKAGMEDWRYFCFASFSFVDLLRVLFGLLCVFYSAAFQAALLCQY
jgi:hypothetical protein